MKKGIMLFFFTCYIPNIHTFSVSSCIQPHITTCKQLPHKTIKKIRKITKGPFRYLNALDTCDSIKGSYFGLRPSYGTDEGKEIEIVIVENKDNDSYDIFKRKKSSQKCSSWEKTGTLPYDKKTHKKHGLSICPDGSLHPISP